MSLINQMLKDLEARRSAGDPPPHMAAAAGISSPTPGRRWPLYLSGLGLFLLAMLSAYLLWERQGHGSDAASSTPATTMPRNTAEPAVVEPLSVAEQPAPAPIRVMPTTATEPAEPSAEEKPLVQPPANPPAQASAPAPQPAVTEPPRTVQRKPVAASVREPPQQIERRIRPPSPEQLAEQHYQRGYQLVQQGEHSAGEQRWQQALDAHPAHIPAREGLAGLYLSQGRVVEASALLREGLQHQPGYGQFYLLYARLQLEDGQQQQAIVTLEQGLARQAQGPDYLAFLAALYQRERAFEASIASYQRALSLQPAQGAWWAGLGISLEGADKPGEARQAYREAMERGGLPPPLLEFVQQRLR